MSDSWQSSLLGCRPICKISTGRKQVGRNSCVVDGPQSSNKTVEPCALLRWLYFLKEGKKMKAMFFAVVSRSLRDWVMATQ